MRSLRRLVCRLLSALAAPVPDGAEAHPDGGPGPYVPPDYTPGRYFPGHDPVVHSPMFDTGHRRLTDEDQERIRQLLAERSTRVLFAQADLVDGPLPDGSILQVVHSPCPTGRPYTGSALEELLRRGDLAMRADLQAMAEGTYTGGDESASARFLRGEL